MNFKYDQIPQEMKDLKRWVLWKKKDIGDGKSTKIPVNARNGYGAKSNDESTWCSFVEALSKVEHYRCDGLGFMLGNGLFGVDLDHVHENVELINEFVNQLSSYTEYSQSGEGIHIICKGSLPKGRRRRGNVEMYDNVRFFALTGKLYNNITFDLRECTEHIITLYDKYVRVNEKETDKCLIDTNREEVLSDDEVIAKAKSSKNGNLFSNLYYGQWEGLYTDQSCADAAFCTLLAFWCNKNEAQIDRIFRTSKLYRPKWDEYRGAELYSKITITNACLLCKDVYKRKTKNQEFYNPQTGEVTSIKDYDLNDTGNAQRFVDRFGSNIRYNFDNKCWVIFDGKARIRDNKQIVKAKVDLLIEEMKIEIIKEQDKDKRSNLAKNTKHISNNSGKEAMLKEAMHLEGIPTLNSDYDKDDFLLNCKNGIVNLRNGKIINHDKSFMMSHFTDTICDTSAEPKKFIKFLNEVFNNDKEMIDYIQMAIGITLTGDTKEQCFFQCYGDGANGKSVLLDIIYEMLGDYAINSQIESILARSSNGGASSEIARMNGARFVRTNEPNEGSKFNEGLVKQLVAGDVTTARYLYGMEFEFKPKFKLWIATNYKIIVRGTDYGIWRRMRLLPFKVKFEGKKVNKNLTNELREELPQILGWAVQGCVKWQKEGFDAMPKQIEEEVGCYKQEMDIVASFLKECTREKVLGREKAGDVYKEYSNWAKDGKEYLMSQTKFGIEMSKRYEKKNIGGYTYYIGFVLKKNDTSYIYTEGGITR